jgi:hypothetical protein
MVCDSPQQIFFFLERFLFLSCWLNWGPSTPSVLISDRLGGAWPSPDWPPLSMAAPSTALTHVRRFGGGWWLLTSFELQSRRASYLYEIIRGLVLQDESSIFHSCHLTPEQIIFQHRNTSLPHESVVLSIPPASLTPWVLYSKLGEMESLAPYPPRLEPFRTLRIPSLKHTGLLLQLQSCSRWQL